MKKKIVPACPGWKFVRYFDDGSGTPVEVIAWHIKGKQIHAKTAEGIQESVNEPNIRYGLEDMRIAIIEPGGTVIDKHGRWSSHAEWKKD